MKKVLIIILTVLISCKPSADNSISENNRRDSAEVELSNSDSIRISDLSEIKIDKSSYQYLLMLSDEKHTEIPSELISKFFGTEWHDENDPYRAFFSEETKHYQLNEIIVLTFQVSYYGVSTQTVLVTCTPSGEKIDYKYVDKISDHDGADPYHTYQGFGIYADTLLQTYTTRVVANDFSAIRPDSITVFDLDSTQVTKTTTYEHFIIKMNGTFQSVDSQMPVLKYDKLKNLSKAELRLIRNEIFARLGYKFKSDDLREYFSHMSWYVPEHDDVTNKLSPFDIRNINLLKNLENNAL